MVVWKVTYQNRKETWSEALVIQDSLGLDNTTQVRSYLDRQRLEDYSLRDRIITKIERIN